MSLLLLFQLYPECLVRLILMVLEIGFRWPYNCCFVRCCFADLFNISSSILVQFPSSFFFSMCLISVYVVHPYSRMDTASAWKKTDIGLHVNAEKTEYMCINQNLTRDISTWTGGSLKLVNNFTYLGSSISSTENDISTRLAKASSAIDRLSVICKLDLPEKIIYIYILD